MSCRGISSLRSEIPNLGRYSIKKMTLKKFHLLQIPPVIIIIGASIFAWNYDRNLGVICLLSVGFFGAFIAIVLGKIPAHCDICSKKSKFIFEYKEGSKNAKIMNKCSSCGLLVNNGRLKIKIEKYDPEL